MSLFKLLLMWMVMVTDILVLQSSQVVPPVYKKNLIEALDAFKKELRETKS